jgi:TldD protein
MIRFPVTVPSPHRWTRRSWLTTTTVQTSALVLLPSWTSRIHPAHERPALPAHATDHIAHLPPAQLQVLAQRAVDAARTAGAQYADARLTRTVQHHYWLPNGFFDEDVELVGMGVRALVHGYWGFTACPLWLSEPDREATVVQLAQDAVAQARVNAQGTPRTVALGTVPVVTGTWATPVEIDPFSISIEEKQETIQYWVGRAERVNLTIPTGSGSHLIFVRQERVLATSEGTQVTQTCYESGGVIKLKFGTNRDVERYGNITLPIHGIDTAGAGWELFAEAQIPEQIAAMPDQLKAKGLLDQQSKPSTVGRYTIVCDGATMASLVEQTLGVATQLDRALGYEANAGGTSFLDDPLAMVGQYQVTSPLVTVTANRSAPRALATVNWDEEGVVPEPFPVIKDGVLVDFQTTREQAAWLAPYYAKTGRPVTSHGCAAAEDASYITLQHMPNLVMTPSAAAIRLEDLVADVQEGILVEGGGVTQIDSQARNGLLDGAMREIKHGRLGRSLTGGTVQFATRDLWKHVTAVGGATTAMGIAMSAYESYMLQLLYADRAGQYYPARYKGQPAQTTRHSVQAVAATIPNQPLINAERKA